MEEIKSVDQFEQDVLKNTLPVLVDYFTTWCGPCKILSPIVNEVGKEQEGKLVVYKVNIEDLPDLAGRYAIQAVPALMLYKQGEVVAQRVGAMAKGDLERWVLEHL